MNTAHRIYANVVWTNVSIRRIRQNPSLENAIELLLIAGELRGSLNTREISAIHRQRYNSIYDYAVRIAKLTLTNLT